jgi:hypothetical protein
MLWFKGWRETRSRVIFAVLWSAMFLSVLAGQSAREGGDARAKVQIVLSMLTLVWLFIPVWLAGSGIRTQPPFGFGSSKGLHGSTQFTLSLPVTRTRLVLVRAALGLFETVAVIAVLTAGVWLTVPALSADTAPVDWVLYLLTVCACAAGVYGLTLVAAMLLDDVALIPASTVAIIGLWTLHFSGVLPPWTDIFWPMGVGSPLMTHEAPWIPVALTLLAGAAGLLVSLKIAERQNF